MFHMLTRSLKVNSKGMGPDYQCSLPNLVKVNCLVPNNTFVLFSDRLLFDNRLLILHIPESGS